MKSINMTSLRDFYAALCVIDLQASIKPERKPDKTWGESEKEAVSNVIKMVHALLIQHKIIYGLEVIV